VYFPSSKVLAVEFKGTNTKDQISATPTEAIRAPSLVEKEALKDCTSITSETQEAKGVYE
jgi:hypothetical protein